jgi:hypothetical protein
LELACCIPLSAQMPARNAGGLYRINCRQSEKVASPSRVLRDGEGMIPFNLSHFYYSGGLHVPIGSGRSA